MAYAYIGFGSNLGDRFSYINQALQRLSETEGVSLTQVSALYETEPVGYEAQDPFLNGVSAIETSLSPNQLLERLQQIEQQVGRQQRRRWGPREIDLDLLIYDQCCINTPELVLPHSELHKRRFVLTPFAEIAPDVIHPILQQHIRTLLCNVTDDNRVERVAPAGIPYQH